MNLKSLTFFVLKNEFEIICCHSQNDDTLNLFTYSSVNTNSSVTSISSRKNTTMEEESKQNKSNDTNEDEEDDINNINKEPSPFAPSDLSIEGFDCSLTSHRNKIILREKVVLLGNAAVGKSSLVQSFISSVTENINNKHYLMTAGVNLNVKQVPIPNSNITVDLFLYDTGGQGIFNKREKSSSFWTNCSYVICIFDVTSRKTLQSCETWMKAIRSSQKQYGSVNVVDSIQSIILVANKIDLREVGNINVKSPLFV